jgi:hypothetical protein
MRQWASCTLNEKALFFTSSRIFFSSRSPMLRPGGDEEMRGRRR